jgi:hypothetical protein
MKKLLYVVPVLALLAVSCNSTPEPSKEPNQPSGQNQQQQDTPSPSTQQNSGSTNAGQPSNTWTGTLRASDNKAKGNLMIMVDGHNLYINTSRDFSGLVGKEVNVSYTGTLDSFTLVNISAK